MTDDPYWKTVDAFIDATLERYKNCDSDAENQVYARGPFAGMSIGEVKQLATHLHNSRTDFPLWPISQ